MTTQELVEKVSKILRVPLIKIGKRYVVHPIKYEEGYWYWASKEEMNEMLKFPEYPWYWSNKVGTKLSKMLDEFKRSDYWPSRGQTWEPDYEAWLKHKAKQPKHDLRKLRHLAIARISEIITNSTYKHEVWPKVNKMVLDSTDLMPLWKNMTQDERDIYFQKLIGIAERQLEF